MNRIFLLFLLLGAAVLSACEVMEPADIEGLTVLDTGQVLAEEIMQALINNDYAAYTRNFNQDMLDASSLSNFEQLNRTLTNILGAYDSLEYLAIEEADNLILIYYKCNFEKGEVTMKLVLEPEYPYLVTGLWFSDFNP